MRYLINGPIPAKLVAERLEFHQQTTHSGAHAIFLGQVRADQSKNQTVDAIEYDAYFDMAERLISTETDNAIREFKLNSAEIYHSVGLVKAGFYSVLVIVNSGHRKASLNALEHLVERIKYHIPIWKREIFTDGSSHWVDEKLKRELNAKYQ